FQAEDGIRDRNVTGVQTCALPISVVIVVASNVERMAVDALVKSVYPGLIGCSRLARAGRGGAADSRGCRYGCCATTCDSSTSSPSMYRMRSRTASWPSSRSGSTTVDMRGTVKSAVQASWIATTDSICGTDTDESSAAAIAPVPVLTLTVTTPVTSGLSPTS